MAVVMSTGIEAANTKSDSALFLEAVLQGDLEQVKQRLDQGVHGELLVQAAGPF